MHEHQLFLLRHAQTERSASGQCAGRTDLPLSAIGERQAHAAGRTYALMSDEYPALVLSSPRSGALRTAELAGLAVSETTTDLDEWDHGEYEGLTPREIGDRIPGWTVWSHPVPGGESVAGVGDRADRLLRRVHENLPERAVILVVHGEFGRVLIARWLGLDAAAGQRFRLDPASLTVLGRTHAVPQLLHLNVPPS